MNDIKQFEAELKKALKQSMELAEAVVAKVAFDGTQKIIQETPKDTGRAQANWQVQINKVNDYAINIPDLPKKGDPGRYNSEVVNMAIEQCDKAMSQFKLNDVINILNNVEYILELEYGSSQQAPKGWVRSNAQIIENKLDEALSKI